MTQQVSTPPPLPGQTPQPAPKPQGSVSKKGVVTLLVLVGMLFLLFTSQLLWNISQTVARKTSSVPRPSPTFDKNKDVGPLLPPGQSSAPQLVLATGEYVVYQQQKNIFRVPVAGGPPTLLSTPGYIYTLAVPPLLTPSGQLLYSGEGLWLTAISQGTPRKIAPLPAGQVITSLVLSSDGTTIAWSTEPANGIGNTTLYAGPLESSVAIYQHSVTDCPCYRVFSFPGGKGANSTVLLTDDRGDHHAVHYGLWSLNIGDTPLADPHQLLDGDAQQGPLTASSSTNMLLYSTNQGTVPAPNDQSVPVDIAALNYANSLSMARITVSTSGVSTTVSINSPHVVLPEQHDLANSAAYHWVTTPVFSADGRALVYVEFSSDAQIPFNRHSAVYVVHISGSGTRLTIGKPQLLATSTDLFVELGVWVNSSVLTFYSDGTLYAIDVTNGAVATLHSLKTYSRVIAVVQDNNP